MTTWEGMLVLMVAREELLAIHDLRALFLQSRKVRFGIIRKKFDPPSGRVSETEYDVRVGSRIVRVKADAFFPLMKLSQKDARRLTPREAFQKHAIRIVLWQLKIYEEAREKSG